MSPTRTRTSANLGDDGKWVMPRASKVIGSSVYNDHDEKVGSIDDLLIGKDGAMKAVLSVSAGVPRDGHQSMSRFLMLI